MENTRATDHLLDYQVLTRLIRNRQTVKVLADTPREDSRDWLEQGDRWLMESIATAGWAPFHYARQVDGIAEPWRFYLVRQHVARQLASRIQALGELKAGSKLPRLLLGCSSLVLVTWIPEPKADREENDTKKWAVVNEEHFAASAAAVQNLLLLIEACGWDGYWSSGGALQNADVFRALGIADSERLLAAVFVSYHVGRSSRSATAERNAPPDNDTRDNDTRDNDTRDNDTRDNDTRENTGGIKKIVGGKQRSRRSPAHNWAKWIDEWAD